MNTCSKKTTCINDIKLNLQKITQNLKMMMVAVKCLERSEIFVPVVESQLRLLLFSYIIVQLYYSCVIPALALNFIQEKVK